MSDNDHAPPEALRIRSELQDLSDRVYAAVESGVEVARHFFSLKEDRRVDPWLFSHLVRFGALEYLPDAEAIEEEVEDVSLKRNPMCGIELTHGRKTIRIWKKPNNEELFLQPPGDSPARQRFYVQPQRRLEGTEYLFVDRANFVYVWDLNGSGVDLYLVKPKGFEAKWAAADCEWWIAVEHPATRVAPVTAFDELEDERLDIELDDTGFGDDDPETGA